MAISLLSKPVYREGQTPGEEDSIFLPLLRNLGLPHAISLGPGSKNMAQRFEPEDLTKVIERNERFLATNNLSPLNQSVISIAPETSHPSIIDVTPQFLSRKSYPIVIQADCLITTIPRVPLIHKPADCPMAIIFTTTKNSQPLLALAHLGRPQVNNRVTESVLDYLSQTYGVNAESIFVGITPSIGPKYYYIKAKDQEKYAFLDLTYWKNHITYDKTLEGESIMRIDVLGKILSVLGEKWIPENNIEAYGHDDDVDTFALASKNPPETLSYRYSVSTNQPERNGRIMVAAQLP